MLVPGVLYYDPHFKLSVRRMVVVCVSVWRAPRARACCTRRVQPSVRELVRAAALTQSTIGPARSDDMASLPKHTVPALRRFALAWIVAAARAGVGGGGVGARD